MDGLRSDIAPLDSGLHLESGDGSGAALASAMKWLVAQASTQTCPPFPIDLAALVAGRSAVVLAHLQHGAADRGLFPLLAARYAAWTGDLQGVARAWRNVLAAGGLPRTLPETESAAALWLAGIGEFERTLADLGMARDAADLHSLARRAHPTFTGRRLSGETAASLTALRARLPEMPAPQWTGTETVVRSAWRTWAELEQGRLRAGLDGWRRLVADAASTVRGDRPDPFHTTADSSLTTALFVLTLAHGVLGIEPDAHRSRIRIAPRIASSMESFAATGIRCGDATISLRVYAAGRALTFRIAQDSGAIPLTALLVPVIEGEVAAAFVDDRAAELDVRPYGEGAAVPVQLVLDAERTLRIERAQRG